jgi:hypothetical protein
MVTKLTSLLLLPNIHLIQTWVLRYVHVSVSWKVQAGRAVCIWRNITTGCSMRLVCSLSIDIEICVDQTYSKCGDGRVDSLVWSTLVCHGRSSCKVNVYLFSSLHGSYVQKFQQRSSFAQVIIEYTCGEIYEYVQGSPVEIQAPSNGNLICRSMTTLLSV